MESLKSECILNFHISIPNVDVADDFVVRYILIHVKIAEDIRSLGFPNLQGISPGTAAR